MSWVRQLHRWLSLAFTAAVVLNIGAMVLQVPDATWVGFLALVPLIPLLFTGVYLFALPYLGRGRSSVAAGQAAPRDG